MNRHLEKYVVGLIVGLLLMSMAGCGAHTRLNPQKSTAEVTTTVNNPDGTQTVTTERVHNEGPSGESGGDAAAIDAKGTAPTVKTPHIDAGGGTIDADGSASIAHSSAARWITGIIGFLLMLAGCAGLYLRQPIKAAAGTAMIGLGLLCCAIWIGLALYILAGLALYAAASLWLTGWDAAKFREALRATRAGIADLAEDHPAAHEILTSEDPKKGLIIAHAEGADMKTMKKIDLKDELKN